MFASSPPDAQIQAMARAKTATLGLALTVSEGDIDELCKALEDGANPRSARCPPGLLRDAISRGGPDGPERVAMLLGAGLPLPQGEEQAELLALCVKLGRGGCLKALLDAGATPQGLQLALACSMGRSECAVFLLQAGADPEGPGAPLRQAAMAGCVACAQLLLDAGADPQAIYVGGQGALEAAQARGHQDVARLLSSILHARREREALALNLCAPAPEAEPKRL